MHVKKKLHHLKDSSSYQYKNLYVIRVLLAGRAVAAGGAFEISCDAIFILNPEVGETVHWCPVEGNNKPTVVS